MTAFLGDGIIFILFLVQRKSVVYRTEWTEARKARQRFWWSFRTAEHVKTRLTCKGLHMFSLFWVPKNNTPLWLCHVYICSYQITPTDITQFLCIFGGFNPAAAYSFCRTCQKDSRFLGNLHLVHELLQYLCLALPSQCKRGAVRVSSEGMGGILAMKTVCMLWIPSVTFKQLKLDIDFLAFVA